CATALLWDSCEQPPGVHTQYQSRDSAEQDAEAHERSDNPCRRIGKMHPDQRGQQKRDDGIEQHPSAAVKTPQPEPHDQLEDSFDEQIAADEHSECYQPCDWMCEQKYAHHDVGEADQQLPDQTAGVPQMP